MLTPDEVRHIARLAQLKLSAAEEKEILEHLNGMLEYFKVFDALDTKAIAPMSHSLALSNALANDEPAPGLTTAQALANAPEKESDQVRVPAVIDVGST